MKIPITTQASGRLLENRMMNWAYTAGGLHDLYLYLLGDSIMNINPLLWFPLVINAVVFGVSLFHIERRWPWRPWLVFIGIATLPAIMPLFVIYDTNCLPKPGYAVTVCARPEEIKILQQDILWFKVALPLIVAFGFSCFTMAIKHVLPAHDTVSDKKGESGLQLFLAMAGMIFLLIGWGAIENSNFQNGWPGRDHCAYERDIGQIVRCLANVYRRPPF
jgi:hypothetical protein